MKDTAFDELIGIVKMQHESLWGLLRIVKSDNFQASVYSQEILKAEAALDAAISRHPSGETWERMMKRFIWQFRYSFYMWRNTGVDFKFCWESSATWAQEFPDWLSDKPEECAKEEISNWY